MGKELIQVYPADAILKTDERKQLYKDILEYVEIGELGRGFTKALKVLCFEGKVESLDTMVRNDDGFLHRVNSLGDHLGVYICLASPVVNEQFFASVLSQYCEDNIRSIVGQAQSCLDGNSSLGADLFGRVHCLLKAAEMVLPNVIAGVCLRMFNRYLSRICYRATSSCCLVSHYWGEVSEVILEGRPHERERIADIRELAVRLLGGDPVNLDAYLDSGFIQFCELYFSRQLGVGLLAFLDEVYQSIPESKRIKLDGSQILYSVEQA